MAPNSDFSSSSNSPEMDRPGHKWERKVRNLKIKHWKKKKGEKRKRRNAGNHPVSMGFAKIWMGS